MSQPKTLLFIDSFDELLSSTHDNNFYPETLELIYSVLRHIHKDDQQELLIVGSAEVLGGLTDDIVTPGRFDLHIPIFPPSFDERKQLILHHLTNNLAPNSPLLAILKKQNALNKEFWTPIAAQMKLFSNTMLIDFTQSLKKRLYALYRKDEKQNIELTQKILFAAFTEAKAKLTVDYFKRCAVFVSEAKQNVGQDFPHRILEMEMDLEFYYKSKEEPISKIGFKQTEEKEEETKITTVES